MGLAIFVGFDLPIEFLKVSGAHLPYGFEIFFGFALVLFLLLIRRSVRRWTGMWMVLRKDRFIWNAAMDQKRVQRVNLYLLLEAAIMLSIGIGVYVITDQAWMPALVYGIGTLDNLLFALIGTIKKGFRIGLSSKALLVADREVTVAYFSGLRKVSFLQQTVYFDYIKDLQLTFPVDAVPSDKEEEFYARLEEQFDRDKVFFSKKRD